MTAGLRGILAGASILRHALDAAGHPRAVRMEDWGVAVQLKPGYMVLGLESTRDQHVARLRGLAALPGGRELLEGIELANPPHGLEVLGADLDEEEPGYGELSTSDPADMACRRLLTLMGGMPPPAVAPDPGSALEEACSWPRMTRLLDMAAVPYALLGARGAAIDAALAEGKPVLVCLQAEGRLPQSAAAPRSFAVVIAALVSLGRGTLARVVLADSSGVPRVVPAEDFDAALDPRAALSTRAPVFEPVLLVEATKNEPA